MSVFNDINGKPIVPGSTVIVATSGGKLRKGFVYRTQLGWRSWNVNRVSVMLRNPENKRYMGTYHRPSSMMVVE